MSGHDWTMTGSASPGTRSGVYYWKCYRCGTNRTLPTWHNDPAEPEHPDARAKRMGHETDDSCDERVAQSVTES